jgi:ParB-like chromosome segregation protein Spo0J
MTAVQSWQVHRAADLLTALTGDELKQLADDIAQHGLHEPVTLWRDADGVLWLIDGRNRVAACEMAGVPVRHRMFEGSITDVIAFVRSENVTRRNLTPGQLATYAIKSEELLYEELAAEAKKRQREHGGTAPGKPAESLVADRPQVKTRDKVAALTGAKARNVGKAKRIRERAPDLFDKVDKGEMPIDRADRVIRDLEAQQRRDERDKAEAAAVGTVCSVEIRHGDFREVLADLRNVDAVICDPPYSRSFILPEDGRSPLADLAAWANRALAPGGVMAVLIGQTWLPEVFRLLSGGRPYRWTACFLYAGPAPGSITGGTSYFSHARRINSNWKPLIVYGGGKRVFSDVIRAEGRDETAKDSHPWGQDFAGFSSVIRMLTEPGQTVVDPFMGGGTPLLAAHALGRNVVGCDVDPQAVATARRRLG